MPNFPDFDEFSSDENALEDIIGDLPHLITLRKFADKTQNVRWFQDVGEGPSDVRRGQSQDYLDALGFPYIDTAFGLNWEDDAAAAVSLVWEIAGWEAEEQLRAGLVASALEDLSEDALSVALNHVAAIAGGSLKEHIDHVADLWDLENESPLLTAAAGAAVQAAHQAALVYAADADERHPFLLKYHLFESGRWPIGIAGSTFNLF